MKCSQCLRYNILWTAFTFPMRDLFDLLAKPQENENALSLWDTKDCNYSMKSAIYKSKIKKWFWLNWRILYATDCWTYFTYSLFFSLIHITSIYIPSSIPSTFRNLKDIITAWYEYLGRSPNNRGNDKPLFTNVKQNWRAN